MLPCRLFNRILSLSTLRNATWALSNLCRSTDSPPDFEQFSPSLAMLSHLLFNHDTEVLLNVCNALSSLSAGPASEPKQAIITTGVCPRAIQLLPHTSSDLVSAALAFVSHLALGDNSLKQVLIEEKALPVLGRLLLHEKECIVKHSCIAVGNILSGSVEQIQAVMDANLTSPLIELLRQGDVVKVGVKEAAKAMASLTMGASKEQMVAMVGAGAIAPLCHLLSQTDGACITDALTAIERILQIGTEIFSGALVEQCAG